MADVQDTKKAQTARRIVEILEYFDTQNRHAKVMEIARHFNIPQSSTSELLSALVELGILYKNPQSRTFAPTPRAAMLGSSCQPSLVRDGRLVCVATHLAAETGLGTAILGKIGVNVQVFRWIPGSQPLPGLGSNTLSSGGQTPLSHSAAGWLMLSTLPIRRSDAILRRLRSEAADRAPFDLNALSQTVFDSGRQGYAIGPAGFGLNLNMCAVLLPSEAADHAMAIAFVYDERLEPDCPALVLRLQQSVEACTESGGFAAAPTESRPAISSWLAAGRRSLRGAA